MDPDVAAKMVNFTKTRMLQQAGTAILARSTPLRRASRPCCAESVRSCPRACRSRSSTARASPDADNRKRAAFAARSLLLPWSQSPLPIVLRSLSRLPLMNMSATTARTAMMEMMSPYSARPCPSPR